MGTPHTVDICKYCAMPIVWWNNTGAWEHLGSGTMDQTQSRAFQSGAKSSNLANATLCANPRLLVEQNSVAGKNAANTRTATKR